MYDIVIRKLENFGDLSDSDRRTLTSLVTSTRLLQAGEDIVREGARPGFSCVLLDGFGCRYKMTEEGRRQILSFQFPGDVSDLYSFVLKVMDHNVGALTQSTIGIIPHQKLQELTDTHPHLTRVLWRDTLVDSACSREWMVGLGRRSAEGRVAHLLCEVLLRFKAVGLCEAFTYDLPVTQTDLADCLGMSLVHVNRILQRLRGEDIISISRRAVTILDWNRLRDLAGFDPGYLHMLSISQQP